MEGLGLDVKVRTLLRRRGGYISLKERNAASLETVVSEEKNTQ